MYAKSRKKKFWIPVIALVLVAALGLGIWFGTRGGEPVNVYPFEYIGMTEFWGDAQESYGPVTTDKIQTEFLTDTQTVTEVKVKNGDLVKKGDVLFSFDTTLDGLSLERKRLDVEKIKVQIKAAEERLQDTRKMVPYVPPEPEEPKPEELGEELKDPYVIFPKVDGDKNPYDGKTKETAIICWLKDGQSITDAILQKLFDTATDYQKTTPETENNAENAPGASASAVPDNEITLHDANDSQQEPDLPKPPKITLYPFYNGEEMEAYEIELKEVQEKDQTVKKYIIPDADKINDGGEKTYWLLSATRKYDNAVLTELEISACPEDDTGRTEWEKLWGDGIEVRYVRSATFDGRVVQDDQLIPFPSEGAVELKVDEKAILVIASQLDNLRKETKVSYSIETAETAEKFFQTTTDGNRLFLIGTPTKTTPTPVKYQVTARHEFKDNEGGTWWVDEDYEFSVSVESQLKKDPFYVVFKTTKDNREKGLRTLWQGAKITAYEDGTFDMLLYNPDDVAGFTDYTIEPEQNIEIDLPEIDPNEMYTAEQILDMQKQCYAIIKEQNEKLKLAETEYAIMERELGDGNVYADIDGKVMSLLTEEEAKQQKQPFVKVSGGGGFYIEGSVSELEKENLKIGQEVTINDWSSGGTYTGEVVSIGDFPSDNDNWNGMGNPTASYYPFRAFVDETADLQEGSHVSMSYSAASAEQGIYLEKAFVRTEKGSSYVFVRGSDGKLEKRNVKVGKMLWGSYYEILSGLSEEDYLAFPYGKHVKHGAPTVESDISALYTY